jgi:hypothetical protein
VTRRGGHSRGHGSLRLICTPAQSGRSPVAPQAPSSSELRPGQGRAKTPAFCTADAPGRGHPRLGCGVFNLNGFSILGFGALILLIEQKSFCHIIAPISLVVVSPSCAWPAANFSRRLSAESSSVHLFDLLAMNVVHRSIAHMTFFQRPTLSDMRSPPSMKPWIFSPSFVAAILLGPFDSIQDDKSSAFLPLRGHTHQSRAPGYLQFRL